MGKVSEIFLRRLAKEVGIKARGAELDELLSQTAAIINLLDEFDIKLLRGIELDPPLKRGDRH